MTAHEDLVRAAAEALDAHYIRQHWDGYACSCGEASGTEAKVRRHIAEAAAALVEPLLRRQIAAEIRRQEPAYPNKYDGRWLIGREHAARIVEGTP